MTESTPVSVLIVVDHDQQEHETRAFVALWLPPQASPADLPKSLHSDVGRFDCQYLPESRDRGASVMYLWPRMHERMARTLQQRLLRAINGGKHSALKGTGCNSDFKNFTRQFPTIKPFDHADLAA